MREVVLDTETTGLDPRGGHRLIEVGALELVNHIPTGQNFHQYIDPERDIDEGAFQVHGLSRKFLATHLTFAKYADEFLDFIADDDLIIHNAPFDLSFINMELEHSGHAPIATTRIIDTLQIARRRYPGAQASLDALCKRFEISTMHRELHGALIDANLLASVYLELIGGRQPDLALPADHKSSAFQVLETPKINHPVRTFGATDAELAAHASLVKLINDPIWQRS